jgi:hypothetical protein
MTRGVHSAEAWHGVLEKLVRFQDPTEAIAVLEAAPGGKELALLVRAYLGVLSREPAPAQLARQGLVHLRLEVPDAQDGAPLSVEEHCGAIWAWWRGDYRSVDAHLTGAIRKNPKDLLAIWVGQLLDLFTGRVSALRDRVAAVLPDWDSKDPFWGFLLGMFAFGLEENGEATRGLSVGKEAWREHPDDVWSIHAVSHCFETLGDFEGGLGFLGESGPGWAATGSMLQCHLWWHQGLMALEAGDTKGALEVADERLTSPDGSKTPLDLVDEVSLLWRLWLAGEPVRERMARAAAVWNERDGYEPFYSFNDVHRIMALVGAGQLEAAQAWLRWMADEAQARSTDAAQMTREVALALAKALVAFADDRPRESADLFEAIAPDLVRLGASNAQRDVFWLTFAEACLRAGRIGRARELLNVRMALRERCQLSGLLRRRLVEVAERSEAAEAPRPWVAN